MADDPVHRYYEEKRRRYLRDKRAAAESMTTGTPHDWEEAAAYAERLPEREAGPRAEGNGEEPADRSPADHAPDCGADDGPARDAEDAPESGGSAPGAGRQPRR